MSPLPPLVQLAWSRVPRWARVGLRKIPWLRSGFKRFSFQSSASYWQTRYTMGRTSGAGSYGRLALFKAEFLNELVTQNGLNSLVELGCGDGNQLALAKYPRYLGLDVAGSAIDLCKQRFAADPSKSFAVHDAQRDAMRLQVADAALSLDVVYHLVEDDVYTAYLRHLFAAARRAVVVYASNEDKASGVAHVRHRKFTTWVEQNVPEWRLVAHVPNRFPQSRGDGGETSFADFYVFAAQAEELAIPII